MARQTEFGSVVRYVPAPEPLGAVVVIGVLTLVQLALAGVFFWELGLEGIFHDDPFDNSYYEQQFLAFVLGTSLLDLAAILAIYRRYFLPDVMILKKRKNKYEDLL